MKLCHIVPSLAAEHGGPSRSVRALCQALARQAHEVELLTTSNGVLPPDEPASDGSLRVRTFKRDWPERLCPSAGLRRAVEFSGATIIHHHALWLRTLHYAATRVRRRDARLVLSPRGMMSSWAWQHRGWRKRFARMLVHPGAFETVHGWHATSTEEADEIRRVGFRQPICVAPNGVDAPDADTVSAAAAHWHRVCPATTDRRVALFYSRLHRKKRVLELIDVWMDRGPKDWLLLIVGIPEEYSVATLQNYVAAKGDAGRVAIFDGADHPAPYAVASLFLLPSHSENFALVIAEAMAHGVPALVTDSTPWQAVNIHDVGWCVPWDHYGRALASATAESAEQLSTRGAAAREWILRDFAWSRSAEQLASFYSTLVAA